jgi:hypothetical protein
MIKDNVLSACRHLLGPIARMLLRSGVTWPEFAELSKEVFVKSAREDYGIHGRPTNAARVAMITGLSRREVTRVRDVLEGRSKPKSPPESRISQVLTEWYLDPQFQDADGNPAELPAQGEGASLAALLKKHAGDLPHGALVKELLQLGLIEELGPGRYRVLSRHYVRTQADPDIVRQMGVALHDHGLTLAHNLNEKRSGPARFEGMASNPSVAARYARAFLEFVDGRGQAFLEEIDAWLSRHQVKDDQSSKVNSTRMGVGVYLIHDDSQKDRRK